METPKYYTPTIEEFHVGFEYQSKSLKKEQWIDKICTIDDIYEIDEAIKYDPEIFRVKYLDREDIESFGWKYTNVNSEYFYLNGFHLKHLGKNFYTIYEDKGADEYSFRGTIKNKSELKRLMQQLQILDN